MKLFALAIFGALLSLAPAQAADHIFAGASFNGTTATPVGAYVKDLGSGIYSITGVQVTKITLRPSVSYQTVSTQDFGYDFTTLLPKKFQNRFSLIALGGAGASASATSVGSAFEGGGVAIIHTKHFDIVLGAKIIKTPQSGTQTVPIGGGAFGLN